MAVIKSIQNPPPNGISLESFIYPNQYVSFEEKQSEEWIKNNVDYWASIAYAQYNSREKITKNYALLAGMFDFTDYQDDTTLDPFIKELQGTPDSDTPKHLKHYPIINPPINTLLGEFIQRPDFKRVKAIDQDSKNEYFATKIDLVQSFVQQQIQMGVAKTLAQRGVDINSEEGQQQAQQMSLLQIEEYMRKTYSDIGEQWGNKVLNLAKDYFHIVEKSEDGFKDLLITSEEFHHLELSTNNKMGVNYELLNPRTVWYLGHPNMKHTDIAYAIGYIDRFDISYIINKWDLTEEELDHIKELQANNGYGPTYYPGANTTGLDSIHYNTYNPLAYRQNFLNPGIISPDKLDVLNTTQSSFGQYGNTAFEKFVVVKGYFVSKRKVGLRSYFDEDGNLQTMLVSENYVPLLDPVFPKWAKKEEDKTSKNLIGGEFVEWSYKNEWWEFLKIGADIYRCNPLPFNICPIIGIINNNKNAMPRSLVDLMKPFQVLYNICMNQLYELLSKEKGKVVLMSLRHIPKFKDLGGEDALEVWEEQAREKGVIFVDDSPENLKSPSSFNQYTSLDLTRTSEIQSRYTLAQQLKMECWELVGISRQRIGNIAASETATGTNAALQKSYSQTEPYFRAHEHVMRDVYQTILDVFKWVEENKPESIISHVNTDLENIFLKVEGGVLKTKDLMVFVSDSSRDYEIFSKTKLLADAALQNGTDFSDVIAMYATDSIAELKNLFQKAKEEKQKIQQQQQELEQQKMQQQQEQFQAQLAQAEQQRKEAIENENYNKELDRINKKEIAIISATGYGKVASEDVDNNGIQDILELDRIESEKKNAEKEHFLKTQETLSKNKQHQDKMDLEREKLRLEKEKIKNDKEKAEQDAHVKILNMANDEKIAKINAKNKNKD